MCVINFFQGYLTFDSNIPVTFQINSLTNFISASKWDRASFKYSLNAGTALSSQISPNFTIGIWSNYMCMLSVNGRIQLKMYVQS